jgi:hypothetical protein
MPSNVIYNTQITGTETKFSGWVRMNREDGVGITVDHPAISTGYTVQASNSSEQDIANGTEKVFDYTSVTIPAKIAAEVFGVELVDFKHAFARLKLVNVSGTGTPVITASKRVD